MTVYSSERLETIEEMVKRQHSPARNVNFEPISTEEYGAVASAIKPSLRSLLGEAHPNGTLFTFYPLRHGKSLIYDEVFSAMQESYFKPHGFSEGEIIGGDCFFWNSQSPIGKKLEISISSSR